jgi:hypothetical protein
LEGARVVFAALAVASNKQVRVLHVFFDVVIADRLEKVKIEVIFRNDRVQIKRNAHCFSRLARPRVVQVI